LQIRAVLKTKKPAGVHPAGSPQFLHSPAYNPTEEAGGSEDSDAAV
jgi:hypothetical protein